MFKQSKSWLFFYCILMLISAFSTVMAVHLLQYGSKGKYVREVQSYLHKLNYLKTSPTGFYGRRTVAAVKLFQKEHGLKCDGKVGAKTYKMLITATGAIYSKKEAILDSDESSNMASRGRAVQIQVIPWPIVNQLWGRGNIARIVDLRTGRFFQVKRYGGHYHADVEPVSLYDTQVLLGIYGGRWSWERRAVAVQVGSQLIAASINGMPHGGSSITDNRFSGHFCVHFLGSRLHKNGRVDPVHQIMVKEAAALGRPIGEPDDRIQAPLFDSETRINKNL